MSALCNVLKKSYSRIDGTVAVLVVGSALAFSGFSLANASDDIPVSETTTTVTTGGSAGINTVTVSGTSGIVIP